MKSWKSGYENRNSSSTRMTWYLCTMATSVDAMQVTIQRMKTVSGSFDWFTMHLMCTYGQDTHAHTARTQYDGAWLTDLRPVNCKNLPARIFLTESWRTIWTVHTCTYGADATWGVTDWSMAGQLWKLSLWESAAYRICKNFTTLRKLPAIRYVYTHQQTVSVSWLWWLLWEWVWRVRGGGWRVWRWLPWGAVG